VALRRPAVASPQDDALRARVLARLAENVHVTAEQRFAPGLSAEAVETARRLGDDDALTTALLARHVALLDPRHLDERLEIVEEVLDACDNPSRLAHALQWLVFDLCEAGRIDEARAQHVRLIELSNILQRRMFSLITTGWRAVFAKLDGDIAATERLALDALEIGQRVEAADARSIHTGLLFMIRRWQGRVDELIPATRDLSAGPYALAPWRAAHPLALIESGAVEEGRAAYERVAGAGFDAIPRGFHWLGTMALLAEACAAVGDAAGAAALYERLRPFAAHFVQMSYVGCWGSVERYLGMLAATTGDRDAASAHFEAALDANGRAGAVLLVAATQQAYARCLGDDARAQRLRAQAAAVARERGLPRLAGGA
jgi:hypothetical protein